MNSIDDLRTSLNRHADHIEDVEWHVRRTAVRQRIRAERRRRTSLVAASAAVSVVATMVAAGALPGFDARQPEAAGRIASQVAGVDVPHDISVLGFPYVLEDTATVGDGDRYQVDDTRAERAVTLVGTDLGDGSATLLRDGEAVARVGSGEEAAVPLPLGDASPELRVQLDNTPADAVAGLALYEATGELASGITNGTAVFRDDNAGQPLLGGAFSEPGRSSVEFQAQGASSMQIVFYCDGPDTLWVNVDIDGEPGLSTSCGAHGQDATTNTSGTIDDLAADQEHDFRVYLTEGGSGPAVDIDSVTVGAGVYQQEYAAEALGQSIPKQVEYDGRNWRLSADSVLPAGPADGHGRTVETDETDLLLGFVARGEDVHLTWTGSLTQGASDSVTSDRSMTGLAGVLLRGDTYDVELTGADAVRGTMLIYRPV